jgi:transporter family-2 protein
MEVDLFYFLSLLTGILISVMVAFNGGLMQQYGVYSATIIIHIAGLLLITIMTIGKRENPFSKRQSWYLYLGGVIGVMTTVFNNLSFSRISVSSLLALGLLGQSLTGLIIDQYGLLNMPKHIFKKRKILGLLLILCGIISMTNNFDILAVLVSLLAGVTVVVSRTLNAKLAEYTSVRISTFFNYLIGLFVSIPVFFIFGRNETAFVNFAFSPNIYIYFGGIFGVCIVLLSNITVTKISAFYLSLFLFIGQVFSGILVDVVISQTFSVRNMIGGVFVAAGLCVNLILDKKYSNTGAETKGS